MTATKMFIAVMVSRNWIETKNGYASGAVVVGDHLKTQVISCQLSPVVAMNSERNEDAMLS